MGAVAYPLREVGRSVSPTHASLGGLRTARRYPRGSRWLPLVTGAHPVPAVLRRGLDNAGVRRGDRVARNYPRMIEFECNCLGCVS